MGPSALSFRTRRGHGVVVTAPDGELAQPGRRWDMVMGSDERLRRLRDRLNEDAALFDSPKDYTAGLDDAFEGIATFSRGEAGGRSRHSYLLSMGRLASR